MRKVKSFNSISPSQLTANINDFIEKGNHKLIAIDYSISDNKHFAMVTYEIVYQAPDTEFDYDRDLKFRNYTYYN